MENLKERMKKLHHPDSICFCSSMKLFCFQHMAGVTLICVAANQYSPMFHDTICSKTEVHAVL